MLGSISPMGAISNKEILMVTIMMLLALIALLLLVLHITGKLPEWPAVLMLIVMELIRAGTAIGK